MGYPEEDDEGGDEFVPFSNNHRHYTSSSRHQSQSQSNHHYISGSNNNPHHHRQQQQQMYEGTASSMGEGMLADIDSTTGSIMMKYGSCNESGQMLARELFARELQARELLARELGASSQTSVSQDRLITGHHIRRSSSRHSTTGGRRRRSHHGIADSCNTSVDGSTMSHRSRWEPDPAEKNCQHESASLPAEFLYFKFEQIVERWANQKADSIMSLERRRPKLMNRPPRTITTIANAVSSSNNNNHGIPRFMRNTTTRSIHEETASYASRSVGSTAKQRARTLNRGQPMRIKTTNTGNAHQTTRTPTPNKNNNRRNSTSTTPVRNRRNSSPLPAVASRPSPAHTRLKPNPASQGRKPLRSSSPLHNKRTTGSAGEAQPRNSSRTTSTPRSSSTPKAGGGASNSRLQNNGRSSSPYNRMTESQQIRKQNRATPPRSSRNHNRSPSPSQQKRIPHQQKQDKSKTPMASNISTNKLQSGGGGLETRSPQETTTEEAEDQRQGPNEIQMSQEEEELEMESPRGRLRPPLSPSKPDPEGGSSRPDPEGDRYSFQRNRRVRSPSPGATPGGASPLVDESGAAASSQQQPQRPPPSPSRQRNPSPLQVEATSNGYDEDDEEYGRMNQPPTPTSGGNRNSATKQKTQPATTSRNPSSPSMKNASSKTRASPSNRKGVVSPSTRKPGAARSGGGKASPRKPTSRTPPQETSKSSNRRILKSRLPPLPSFRNSATDSPPKRQSTAKNGQSSPSPTTKNSSTAQNNGSSPSRAKNSMSPRSPSTPSPARTSLRKSPGGASPKDPLKRTPKSPIGSTLGAASSRRPSTPKLDPPSTPRSQSRYQRRASRMYNRSAIILQSYQRMISARRRFLRLRSAVIVLQRKGARKWTRLEQFSCLVIQRNFRMLSCRSSYIQLRDTVIIVQSAIRMFACRSTYVELRTASQRLLGRKSVHPPPKPIVRTTTVRGGRLRIYSALLIQSLVRMRGVRTAYLELRSSAQVLQRWSRRMLRIVHVHKRCAVVLQKWARMLSIRNCFLDLRKSVITMQSFSRMTSVRLTYIAHKRVRLEQDAVLLIQSQYRSYVCSLAYVQLQNAAKTLQCWIRTSRASRESRRKASTVLQNWAQVRLAVISYARMRRSAIMLQCWARQKRSERFVLETICARLIQARFRTHSAQMVFIRKRVFASMIQAIVRGTIYRVRYILLRFVAIGLQKRIRGKRDRARVASMRMTLLIESATFALSDTPRARRDPDTCSESSPDPTESSIMPNETVSESDDEESQTNSGTSMSSVKESDATVKAAVGVGDSTSKSVDRSKHPNRYNDVVSAALAFVSQSPSCTSSKRNKNAKNAGQQSQEITLPEYRKTQVDCSPRHASSSEQRRRLSIPEHHKRQLHMHLRHQHKAKEGDDGEATLRDPSGDNMSRQPSSKEAPPKTSPDPEATASPNQESTKSCSQTQGGDFLLQSYGPSVPPAPRQAVQRSLVPVPPKIDVTSSPLPRGLPGNLVPAPPELVTRLSPVELSPSQQQPLYFISSTSGEGSPQLYALQPINDMSPSQQAWAQNLYYSPGNRQPLLMPQPVEPPKADSERDADTDLSTKGDRKISILEGLKRERKRQTKQDTKHTEKKYPPIPSILENPSFYMPKKEVGTKENNPTSEVYEGEEEEYIISALSPLRPPPIPRYSNYRVPKDKERTQKNHAEHNYSFQDGSSPASDSDPLKQMIALDRKKNNQIMAPSMKKEADCSERAISDRLAAIRQKSRSRKVHKLTQRVHGRSKTPQQEIEQGAEPKTDFVNVAAQHWAKQTQRRKNSIFSSGMDDEFALQIQSAWRSHRDQIRLAASMLQTWNVSCDLDPDTMSTDRILRQTANILALDGAFCQVGYLWHSGNILVKNGLVMVQWDGLIPINFSDQGLEADDTCCSVAVHCTARQSNLLDKWSLAKQKTLLVKAAIEKYSDDQRQKLRRSSMFERSLTKRRTEHEFYDPPGLQISGYQNFGQLQHSANVIQSAFRGYMRRRRDHYAKMFLGIPNDFQQRMRVYSAVLIQSWYRMCRCRSMYQGLRRIQSTILVRTDREDVETIRFHRFTATHKCETIIEEGFECTTGSNES